MKAASFLLCLASGTFFCSIASASPIDITSYNKQTSALFDFLNDATLDSSAPETSTQLDGDTLNATTVEHISSATEDSLYFSMTHSLAAESVFDSLFTTVLIEFIALEDATYSLEGFYSMLASGQTLIYARAFLFDQTTGQDLLVDSSESVATLDETLAFDVPNDGDFDNVFFGSATGNLFAGRSYQFEFSYGLYGLEPTTGNSDATGEVAFRAQSLAAAVPEPGSLGLAFVTFSGLFLRRRKPAKC